MQDMGRLRFHEPGAAMAPSMPAAAADAHFETEFMRAQMSGVELDAREFQRMHGPAPMARARSVENGARASYGPPHPPGPLMQVPDALGICEQTLN